MGDEAALRAAIADGTVDVVEVTAPITLTEVVYINRTVTVRGAGCTAGDAACTQTLDGGGSTQLFYIEYGGMVIGVRLKLQIVRPRPPP